MPTRPKPTSPVRRTPLPRALAAKCAQPGIAKSKGPIALGDRICFEARVADTLAAQLAKHPLGPGQKLTPLSRGRHRLVVTLTDTRTLALWILSQGDAIVVERPHALRHDIRARLENAVAGYSTRG